MTQQKDTFIPSKYENGQPHHKNLIKTNGFVLCKSK